MKSQLKEEYVIENIVVGQTFVNKDTPVDSIVKLNLNINVKIKKYVGTYENLNSFRHDISHGFLVSHISGKIKTDFQSIELRFFKKIPKNILGSRFSYGKRGRFAWLFCGGDEP